MANQRSPGSGQDKRQQVNKATKHQTTLNMAEEKRKAQQEKLKRDQFLAKLEQRKKSRDLNRGR